MEIRVLGPNGNIGTGFKEESFERGLKLNPHVIACDAGSTDSGAYALGAGVAKPARSAIKRDTRLCLLGRDKLKVPLIIGSCGTSGSDVAVDWMRDIVLEIAKEENLHFKLAVIRASQDKNYLKQKLREGKIKPLFPEIEYTEGIIDRSAQIVGVMGFEQLNRALDEGADIVLAGRATDTSLYAVVPIRMGAHPGLTWHMAKTVECGAACAVTPAADSMFVRIRDTEFEVEPLDLELKVTPLSIAAHTLYENISPFEIREPEGCIVTTNCEYLAKDDRSVIVRGSEFRKETYTIKLEGAELIGYQTVIIGGIRDPYIIKHLDDLFKLAGNYFGEKVPLMFPGLKKEDFSIHFRVYGKNGVMGPMEPLKDQVGHEVGLLITITAQTQELATEISKYVAHISAHLPIPEWEGIISTIAYPFSPPEIEKGAVYRFNVNHVVEPDDPFEMFRFFYEEV